MTLEQFKYNPLKTGILYGNVAYEYGECSRRLFYSARDNIRYQAPRAMLEAGNDEHTRIKNTIYKDMTHEHKILRNIPEINGVTQIGARYDCIDATKFVEIKPSNDFQNFKKGSRYQILVEHFVMPELKAFLYAYKENKEYLLAMPTWDYVTHYIARFLTVLKHIPPRKPDVKPNKYPCNVCPFQEECWNSDSEGTKEEWREWTRIFVQPNYDHLKGL